MHRPSAWGSMPATLRLKRALGSKAAKAVCLTNKCRMGGARSVQGWLQAWTPFRMPSA